MSRYMLVNENPDIDREHVHAYVPADLYRRMKLMHQDLNCYSIAQLIREFLRVYFSLVKKYGDDIYKEVKKLFRQWEMEIEKTRVSAKKNIRQLKRILLHLTGQNRLVNFYNCQFSPFWIFRL